jgi:hypothetical protein
MIEVLPEKRWPTDRCLGRGFQNGLFGRRAADDLVVNATEAALQAEEGDDEARTPRVASPIVASPQRTQAWHRPRGHYRTGKHVGRWRNGEFAASKHRGLSIRTADTRLRTESS